MIPKLTIITEIIAPYRIPVFNALAARPQVESNVIFLSENDPTLRHWHVYKDEIKFPYAVLPAWRRRVNRHSFLFNRGVGEALDRIAPDVIICGGYNYSASWQAAYWARARHRPFILWSESTALDRRGNYIAVEWIKKRFLRICSGFLVPGKSSADYLESLGVAGTAIFAAPNAVDNSLFSRCAEAAISREFQVRARHQLPSRYFLHVGRLIREKGVFVLMGAYAQLPSSIRQEVGLVFAGSGAEAGELRRQASTVTVGTVRFLDFLQRNELAEIYALADALIFPTLSDPWGLVVNEAMACGLPIVTTNVAGCAADLVTNGSNGFVVPPLNVSALCVPMAQLAQDSALRKRMGHASRQRIKHYSPEAWAEGVLDVVNFVSTRGGQAVP